MIIHNFDPVILDFGIVQIRWYSIAYLLGIFLGWIYIKKIILNFQIKNNFSSLTKKDFDDLIFYLVIGIILGGRIGYVIFYNLEYYLKNFSEIFMIWNGGMSFHGGLIRIIISIFLFCKKNNINFCKLSDLVAMGAPIGLFLGRIGNFINVEVYGRVTEFPIAMIYPQVDN